MRAVHALGDLRAGHARADRLDVLQALPCGIRRGCQGKYLLDDDFH
jgi:hypothetical protein